jgi:hypothetical protein
MRSLNSSGRTALGLLALAGALSVSLQSPAHAQRVIDHRKGTAAKAGATSTPLQLDFKRLRCFGETGDRVGFGGFGVSDEIYAVFYTADIAGTSATGRAAVTSVFGDVDKGEIKAQTVKLWHPRSGTRAIANRDDILLLAAVMESDDNRSTTLRREVERELNTNLRVYKGSGLRRAEMVRALSDDMNDEINANKGGDDRVGATLEVRPSNGNLVDARNGTRARLARDFRSGDAHYQLELELSK